MGPEASSWHALSSPSPLPKPHIPDILVTHHFSDTTWFLQTGCPSTWRAPLPPTPIVSHTSAGSIPSILQSFHQMFYHCHSRVISPPLNSPKSWFFSFSQPLPQSFNKYLLCSVQQALKSALEVLQEGNRMWELCVGMGVGRGPLKSHSESETKEFCWGLPWCLSG